MSTAAFAALESARDGKERTERDRDRERGNRCMLLHALRKKGGGLVGSHDMSDLCVVHHHDRLLIPTAIPLHVQSMSTLTSHVPTLKGEDSSLLDLGGWTVSIKWLS